MSTPDTTVASFYAETHPSTEAFMLALTDLFKQHGRAIVPTHEGAMSFHDHMMVVDPTPDVLEFIERTTVEAYGEDAEFANALEDGMRESGIVEIEKQMIGAVTPAFDPIAAMRSHRERKTFPHRNRNPKP